MLDVLHISESGLKATQSWINQISNNVANMQTAGFKKSTVTFEDLVNAPAVTANYAHNGNTSGHSDNLHGMGARLSAPTLDFSEGAFKATYKPHDIAIKGAGFLEVVAKDGSLAYTRVGSLVINRDGMLALASGHTLSDDIQVPPDATAITISKRGLVEASFDNAAVLELGQIHLTRITNPAGLQAVGGGLYRLTEESGDPIIMPAGEQGMGDIQQGFLEMSNVELVEEMTNLVLAQRAYQLNARLIQTADQILETVNNLRR